MSWLVDILLFLNEKQLEKEKEKKKKQDSKTLVFYKFSVGVPNYGLKYQLPSTSSTFASKHLLGTQPYPGCDLGLPSETISH